MIDALIEGLPTEVIADEDWLYRRLASNHLRSDGTINRTAFMRNCTPPRKGKEPDPQVSVDLARLSTPERVLAERPNQGVGTIQASFPRMLGLEVVHAPIVAPPERQNPAHTLIQGNEGERAMEYCELLAEQMSKHILIYPVGSPLRPSGTPE